MIIDIIANLGNYTSAFKGLASGMEAIKGWEDRAPGRYEFDGGFYMIQDGDTAPMDSGDWEAHRKYIDVQIVVGGSEDVGWDDISNLTVSVPYNAEKDAEFFSGEAKHIINMSEGTFYIAFPNDAHKPTRHVEKQQHYTKIVMKLPV